MISQNKSDKTKGHVSRWYRHINNHNDSTVFSKYLFVNDFSQLFHQKFFHIEFNVCHFHSSLNIQRLKIFHYVCNLVLNILSILVFKDNSPVYHVFPLSLLIHNENLSLLP